MRVIELVHEDLAERLTNSLPPFIRTNVRTRVVHAEQGRFHDYLKDIPPATLFHLVVMAPLPGKMILTISSEISTVILEQRLGGQGSQPSGNRTLTEIDQFLLRGMIEYILNDVKISWSKLVAVETSLEDSTTNQHWVQMVMGNERVMVITVELAMATMSGNVNIYIPFTMLKPIASMLNPHVWFSGKERHRDNELRAATESSLSQVRLSLRVFLGDTDIQLKDLLALKPGDIIELDAHADDDLPVIVSDQLCFMARPGKVGVRPDGRARMAAQISQFVNREVLSE
jgi:flagellar motor switch protein FliM